MKNTKIIIIRHGESLANAERVYLGHSDWDLSPLGKAQAERAADYFKDEKIDAIYSSDLLRAYNTALPHSKLHSLDVNADRELREVFLGAWEGLKIDYISERWHKEFNVDWRENFGICTPPKGESVPHAAERFFNEVLRIAQRHVGSTVLITAHAAVIRGFWGVITGTKAEEVAAKIPFPTNASASTVEFDGEKLIPINYSFDEYVR